MAPRISLCIRWYFSLSHGMFLPLPIHPSTFLYVQMGKKERDKRKPPNKHHNSFLSCYHKKKITFLRHELHRCWQFLLSLWLQGKRSLSNGTLDGKENVFLKLLLGAPEPLQGLQRMIHGQGQEGVDSGTLQQTVFFYQQTEELSVPYR